LRYDCKVHLFGIALNIKRQTYAIMKIFVAYSFHDAWIKKYVFEILKAYGIEVESGEELEGQQIDDGVKEKIKLSDAMIAFTTRRDKIEARDAWKTSDWVIQEMDHADSIGMTKVLEFRELGVEFTGGRAGNRQLKDFNSADQLQCLVELARIISRWRSGIDMRVKLLPEDLIGALWPVLRLKDYECSYIIRRAGQEIARADKVNIVREDQGLFIYPRAIPLDAFLEVSISVKGQRWSSPARSVGAFELTLEKE
jgi:hypothetical protein